jgi:hypothetical protein
MNNAGDMFSPADGRTQISTKEGGLFQLSKNDDVIAAPGLASAMAGLKQQSHHQLVLLVPVVAQI